MCITTTCKNSFLKPATSHLNPNAQEWTPLHLHHLLPLLPAPALPPPPPFAAHLHQKLLIWPLPLPHPSHFYHPLTLHMQPTCSQLVYFPPPFSFPAAAPPLFHCEEKVVYHAEKKGCVKMIVKRKDSEMWKPPQPLRSVWRAKKIASDGGAAASPPPSKKVPAATSPRTTVMVRNIPNQLRRKGMLAFIDRYCVEHSLKYDFMYLPMDFSRKDNLGYAFVNFTSGRDALKFKKIVNNFKWGIIKTEKGSFYNSTKICAITWGRIQGKDRLVEKFENSIFQCDNPDFLPVVFDPPRDGSNTTPPVIVGTIGKAN